jgi:hypothetical protein
MMRGLMEHIFDGDRLDRLFERHAKVQYQRELLFSSVVDLLSLVVCGIHPSVNAASKAKAETMNVNRAALYQKLNGVELGVSAALVRETAAQLRELIAQMGGQSVPLLAGYTVRILDGNALAASEHRLKVLRSVAAAPLPGKSLVVLDPELRLAVDIFSCADGDAQERRLLATVLATVQPQQLWIADRNMCTLDFLRGIDERQATFVIREHQGLPWQPLDDLACVSQTEAGELWEQAIAIQSAGVAVKLRRIVLTGAQPTRHGQTEMVILSNLPVAVADAEMISQLYRDRWQVEGLFLTVTMNFESEIQTLAYPQAALLSFSLALVTYHILATLKAALASVHGVETIEATLSDFDVVDELQGTYRGMMIAIAPEHWQCFRDLSTAALADVLKQLAAQVKLKRFLKQPRKSKSKSPPRIKDPNHPHVSTAKLLSR